MSVSKESGVSAQFTPKDNFRASTAPGVSDDARAGYSAGSTWIDTVTDSVYRCTDATAGAAVWMRASMTPSTFIAAASAAINAADTYVASPLLIPANSLVVGNTFRIKVTGVCTSTGSNTINFAPRIGPAGTVADARIGAFSTTSAASGTNSSWRAEFELVIRAIGASGAVYAAFNLDTTLTTTGISTSINVVQCPNNTTAFDATVANYLGLSIAAAATTSVTVTSCSVTKLV